MLRYTAALSFVLFATACTVDMSTEEQDLDNKGDTGGGEPHDAKVVHVNGEAKPGGGGGGSPNLIWHGGPVMRSGAVVEPIFWGTSWANYSGDKISGLQSFYGGMGTTTYD